jgi:hypothetical protein
MTEWLRPAAGSARPAGGAAGTEAPPLRAASTPRARQGVRQRAPAASMRRHSSSSVRSSPTGGSRAQGRSPYLRTQKGGGEQGRGASRSSEQKGSQRPREQQGAGAWWSGPGERAQPPLALADTSGGALLGAGRRAGSRVAAAVAAVVGEVDGRQHRKLQRAVAVGRAERAAGKLPAVVWRGGGGGRRGARRGARREPSGEHGGVLSYVALAVGGWAWEFGAQARPGGRLCERAGPAAASRAAGPPSICRRAPSPWPL